MTKFKFINFFQASLFTLPSSFIFAEVRHDLTLSTDEIYFENPSLFSISPEGNDSIAYKTDFETFEGNKTSIGWRIQKDNYASLFISSAADTKGVLPPDLNSQVDFVLLDNGVISYDFLNYTKGIGVGFNSPAITTSSTVLSDTYPVSSNIKVGSTWYKITHAYSLNFSEGYFHDEIKTSFFKLKGYAEIDTPWGKKNAIWIEEKAHHEINHENAVPTEDLGRVVSHLLDIQVFHAFSKTDHFLIKGLGEFSSSGERKLIKDFNYDDLKSEQFENWVFEEGKIASNLNEIPKRYMEFGKYINSKFESSTMDLNVSDFIQISKDEFTEQQTQPFLNSWTWNGAFPWVYNHETESWFYYSFAGNTCNA